MELSNRYYCEHRISYRINAESRYSWFICDREKRQAVEFHGDFVDELKSYHDSASKKLTHGRYKGKFCLPYGIEIHNSKGEGEPPIKNCSVLCGDCYPDGTSLGASRFAEHWSGTDEEVWIELMKWFR